ncbi:hypothetical protein AOXY_G29460 [Acipenser oxyrinchus oxyrinchus]|uniref:Uncharacterized protein n=1 Tax=Acipenser oxyrinchus oxyrinchus TaxID=40147 RepID=A0AAD8CNR4_ACIOX|nr:hypothetical protein AOXY_G29460 [Acipenser oxyrinchus oxyrinchus]
MEKTMPKFIPKSKAPGVDICGGYYYRHIIRSDLGCLMSSSNFNKGSDLALHSLHPSCRGGDSYLCDNKYFYIIKGDEYRG